MNIYKHDLKIGIKPFIFWTIGLVFLIIVGMTKFLGFSGGSESEMALLMDKIPRVVLMVFGMADVDVLSLDGFYSVLENYVIICTIIYAIQLGSNAVARESIDKTYEFIFTKPCTRSYILFNKILASFTYLLAFSILNYVLSYASFFILNIENTIGQEVALFALANALIGLLFFTLSIFLSSFATKSEKGIKNSYILFMVAYFASIVYDVFEWASVIKFITPLRYFKSVDIIAGRFDLLFVVLCLILSIVFLIGAFRAFEKRDLNAV